MHSNSLLLAKKYLQTFDAICVDFQRSANKESKCSYEKAKNRILKGVFLDLYDIHISKFLRRSEYQSVPLKGRKLYISEHFNIKVGFLHLLYRKTWMHLIIWFDELIMVWWADYRHLAFILMSWAENRVKPSLQSRKPRMDR